MARLIYRKGDATEPVGEGNKIIPHVVNDKGQWGRGFVVALSEKWTEPESDYFRICNDPLIPEKLGSVWIVPVEIDVAMTPTLCVANMFAQHDTRARMSPLRIDNNGDKFTTSRPPIRYGALAQAMQALANYIHNHDDHNYSIHAPRFGAGLAGGDWTTIELMIAEIWVDAGIDVTIYDLE